MEAIATLVENDPYMKLPFKDRLHARRARRDRIAAKAVQSELPVFSLPERQPAPEFSFGRWIERQARLNPMPKPAWFCIVAELNTIPRQPKIEEIQRVVRTAYRLTKAEFVAERRTAPVVRARQIAMYLAKTMTCRSLPEIGRRFGGRDHTTVLHAVRKIEALIVRDTQLAAEVGSFRLQVMERP